MPGPDAPKGRKNSNSRKGVSRGPGRKAKKQVAKKQVAKKTETKKTETKKTETKKARKRKASGRAETTKAPGRRGEASATVARPERAGRPGSAEETKPGNAVPPELPAPRQPRTREDLMARKEEEISLMLRLLQEVKDKESRGRITVLSRRRRS